MDKKFFYAQVPPVRYGKAIKLGCSWDYTAFIADYAWGGILRDRADAVKILYPDKYPM